MKKNKPMGRASRQMRLPLPNRQPLVGLPSSTRSELLDAVAQLLVQAEKVERPTKEAEDE